jgi:hypothetical protein
VDSRNFLFVSADAALTTDLAWQVHRETRDIEYYSRVKSDKGDTARDVYPGYGCAIPSYAR